MKWLLALGVAIGGILVALWKLKSAPVQEGRAPVSVDARESVVIHEPVSRLVELEIPPVESLQAPGVESSQVSPTRSVAPPTKADPRDEWVRKYAGWTADQLHEKRYELWNRAEEIAEAELAKRRREGKHFRVLLEKPGSTPVPPELQDVSLADRWTQVILNPDEEFSRDRRAEDPIPVWWIALTRTEYPELFSLRDEAEWLRMKTSSK